MLFQPKKFVVVRPSGLLATSDYLQPFQNGESTYQPPFPKNQGQIQHIC